MVTTNGMDNQNKWKGINRQNAMERTMVESHGWLFSKQP